MKDLICKRKDIKLKKSLWNGVLPLLLLIVTACHSSMPAAVSKSAPASPQAASLTSITVSGEDKYDTAAHMLRIPFKHPGSHSRIADGALVHPTRDSMYHACFLLSTTDPVRHARAADIIRAVLPLQETDVSSKWCGTWPWVLEEPVRDMRPPDMNFCAFIGVQLAEMLLLYRDRLPADLIEPMQVSLRRAAQAMMRRNVDVTYTNITMLTATAMCAAGEAMNDREILNWGRAKLRTFVEFTEREGGFAEYNSPAYTHLMLFETNRLLFLVKDPQAREDAGKIWNLGWRMVADHYHPGLAQWVGPYSRTYTDVLSDYTAQFLADHTGLVIGSVKPRTTAQLSSGMHPRYPCPPELLDRFRRLPKNEMEVRSLFRKGQKPNEHLAGTTWFASDAALGSINRDSTWTQARPILAHWGVEGAKSPAVLRVRCWKDGHDFGSGFMLAAQAGPRVAAGLGFLANRGDTYLWPDGPERPGFPTKELRIRCELTAQGASVRQLMNTNSFELAAGKWHAVIYPASGSVDHAGKTMRWETGGDPASGRVWVDGIYYSAGESFTLHVPRDLPPFAGVGIELLRSEQNPSAVLPVLQPDGKITWTPAKGTCLATETH